MTPYKVWKTLRLHGKGSAREVIAHWAVVPVGQVRAGAIEPVLAALELLDERRLVEPVERGVQEFDADTVWRTLPLPDDDDERKRLVKELAATWRRERRTVDPKRQP